ncbi:MAG: hypothetical protein ACI88C_001472 [Acidimicrobiales bacterium]|jgi:hypothetical protein
MPSDLKSPTPKKSPLLLLPLLAALCVLSSCGTSETVEPASPPEAVEEVVAADSEPGDSGADDSEPDISEPDDSEPDDSDADVPEPDDSDADVPELDNSGAGDSDEGLTEESGAMVEEDQESDQIGSEGPAIAGEATPGFAALSDIDQALIIGLNTYDWDTQPWVSADIESIDVPEGTDFSVTLTLENFTESPIFALACDATFVWEFFTAAAVAATGQQLCSPPAVAAFDNDGEAVITTTSTGEGACWAVGGFGSEIGFICIPFGDLDGYSSADCADSELGEGVLFPLSDGVLWCNFGEVSQPLGAME